MKDRDIPAGERFITPERAAGLFALQLKMLPDLGAEFDRIAGRSLGLQRAVIETVAEAISEDPMAEVTPARIREITGAPGPEADDAAIYEWGKNFWDAFKEKEIRKAQEGRQNPFSR